MWLNYKKPEVFHVIYKNKIQSLQFVHIPNFWLIWHNVSLREKKKKKVQWWKDNPGFFARWKSSTGAEWFCHEFLFLASARGRRSKTQCESWGSPTITSPPQLPNWAHWAQRREQTWVGFAESTETKCLAIKSWKTRKPFREQPVNNLAHRFPHLFWGLFPSSGSPLKAAGPAGHPSLTLCPALQIKMWQGSIFKWSFPWKHSYSGALWALSHEQGC